MDFVLKEHTYRILVGNDETKGRNMPLFCHATVCVVDPVGHKIVPEGYGLCGGCSFKIPISLDTVKDINGKRTVKCPECKMVNSFGAKEIVWTTVVVSKHRRKKKFYYHKECELNRRI